MNRFKMLARDHNSSPTQYRTWVVSGQPDFTGALYTGLKSGDTPFDDVTTTFVPDGYIMDFNLPNPLDWITTERVLPEAIADSQLAVIDGYVYLFGGDASNKIFRATLNNPADWINTGATLPNIISSSHLAIVDGYVYLFGGNDGYTATDHIFSAPVTNPLSWTDHGSLLPGKLQLSQLILNDGYIYLLGGHDGYNSVNTIFKSTPTNPLSWTNLGSFLPDKLYSSQAGIIDGYVYLFGGLKDSVSPTNTVYSCALDNIINWSASGSLPYPSFSGQFVTIGQRGYLITPTNSTTSFTKILKCNLSNPNMWSNTKQTVPGLISSSQLAIIYDRIFLFGGNGSSVIFADNQFLKYIFNAPDAVNYANVTRTLVNTTPNKLNLFGVLGFPYWKTNYV